VGQVKEKLKKGYQYPVIGYMLGFGSEIRGERRKLLLIIFIKIGAMHELFLSALKFLEYPQNIYKGMIRILMIYIIPLATVSNVPAEKILGKVGMIDTIEIVLLSLVFFMLTRICYRLALKRYSSASS